ncbi:recombinase family protein [Alkaliphilus sp. MSJ-5]|uniref:Recombinase family protein n=1 Tax=Alkaliphilus flagellatus TaxID=2841507 RepID=A0ABS6G6I5_9FIRM|nr:recombinase family protein [Alkaliphilus flagellatus]MBU5677984.1 recombinase family protein [Alkaliphilus flagellatus]
MKVAIYSRKSKFTGKGDSIENQIQLCKNYATTHFGIKDNDFYIYEDEGFSGGNTDRPQFQLLMKDAKKKKFDILICYRLDRISRSVMDFSNTFETLESNGVGFVSIKEQFDTSTPMGKAMLYISSVFAQLERETAAERIKDNMLQLAKTGRWLGGITPTGYSSKQIIYTDPSGKERKMFKLSTVDNELEIVRLIFDKYLEFKSLTKVEQYLIINNIKSKNDIDFTRYSIRSILANPVYAVADKTMYDYIIDNGYEVYSHESEFTGKHGIMAYNKTNQDSKSSIRFRDVSEWIVAIGAHKGIIESTTWIKAQNLLYKNKSKGYRRVKNTNSLLSGVLYCSCGSYMRPKMGRKNKDGEQIFYYMCEMKEKSKRTRCNIKNIKGNELDHLIIDRIKNLAMSNSDVQDSIENDKISLQTAQNAIQNEISMLESNIKNNGQSIGNLVSSLSQNQNSTAAKYIIDQIEGLDKETAQIKDRLLRLKEVQEKNQAKENSLDVMKGILSNFNDSVDLMDIEDKRAFLKIIVDKIIWNGKNAEIIMFGSISEKKQIPPRETE